MPILTPVSLDRARPALEEAVARARASDPLAPVTIAVASNFVALDLRRWLASGGSGRERSGTGGIVNVRFVNLLRIAEMLGAPSLEAAGRIPLSDAVAAEAARMALADCSGRLDAWKDHPATLAAVERSLLELREWTEEERSRLAESGEFGHAAQVYRAYRGLIERRYYDREDVAETAAEAAQTAGSALDDIGYVIVFMPRRLTAGQIRLLKALGGRAEVLLGLTGDAEADAAVLRMAESLGADTTQLATISSAAPPSPPTARRILIAPDPEQEARAAIRWIMARLEADPPTPLNRMAVVYAQRRPYAAIAHEQLRAAGIPFNGASAGTLAQTVYGRSLLAFFEMASDDFSRKSVMTWLASCPVRSGKGGKPVPGSAWERESRQAGIVAGSEWERRIDASLDRLRRSRADDEDEGDSGQDDAAIEAGRRKTERLETLKAFISDLKKSVAPLQAGDGSWKSCAGAARDLLETYLGRPGRAAPDGSAGASGPIAGSSGDETEERLRADEDAWKKIRDALGQIAGLDDFGAEPPTPKRFRLLLERMLSQPARRISSFGAGVFVGTLSEAAGLDLDALFLIGAADGNLPLRPRTDPILPGAACEAAGRTDSRAEEARSLTRRDFLAVLAGSKESWLLCSRAALRSGSRLFPSPWLIESAAALKAARDGADRDAHVSAGDIFDAAVELPGVDRIASFESALRDSSRAGSLQEFDLSTLLRLPRTRSGVAPHERIADLNLSAGFECIERRRDRNLSCWDGWLAGEEAGKPASAADGAYSPTSLERLAKCPFNYFLQNVLGVYETREPEDVFSLQPKDRGTLVHAILARFWTEVALKRPDPAALDAWTPAERDALMEIAASEFEAFELSGLCGKPLLWEVQKAEIVEQLGSFLKQDAAFRKSYGLKPLDAELDLETAGDGPIALRFGDGPEFLVKGRIDRVDSGRDGSLVVVDYKTGKSLNASAPGLDAGKRLQPLFYSRAISAIMQAPAVSFFYWQIAPGGVQKQIPAPVGLDMDEEAERVLGILVDCIECGKFPANPGESYFRQQGCAYCAYDRICRSDRVRAWLRARSTPGLEGYLSLSAPAQGDDE
jgi:hypothetical protein